MSVFRSFKNSKSKDSRHQTAQDVMQKVQAMSDREFREFFGMSPEPNLQLVRSVVVGNERYRPLFDQVIRRPNTETFHEFLAAVVKVTLGENWWKHQKSSANPHVAVKWSAKWEELMRDSSKVTNREIKNGQARNAVLPTGQVTALMTLGYDLYLLQTVNKLPAQLVERLKRSDDFQSARYEIACAAIMMRAGFTIEFFDESSQTDKHCEFLATRTKDGIIVGVEAKSRIRAGTMNQPGDFDYTAAMADGRGPQRLLRQAKKQAPKGLPFLIFIDVNHPPSPAGTAVGEWPWLKTIPKSAGKPEDGRDTPYNALIFTNFGHHFGIGDETTAPSEGALVPSIRAAVELPDSADCFGQVARSVVHYSDIPNEV